MRRPTRPPRSASEQVGSPSSHPERGVASSRSGPRTQTAGPPRTRTVSPLHGVASLWACAEGTSLRDRARTTAHMGQISAAAIWSARRRRLSTETKLSLRGGFKLNGMLPEGLPRAMTWIAGKSGRPEPRDKPSPPGTSIAPQRDGHPGSKPQLYPASSARREDSTKPNFGAPCLPARGTRGPRRRP